MPEEIQLREKGRKQASLTPAFFFKEGQTPEEIWRKKIPPEGVIIIGNKVLQGIQQLAEF